LIAGHNITDLVEKMKLQEEINSANLMSSYMSHEMITPLKCLGELAIKVENSFSNSIANTHYIQVIGQTTQLMLANIRNNLD
jgi:hypothetical protein